MKPFTIHIAVLLMLGACSGIAEKVENIGKPPSMTKVENPHVQRSYQPLSWPLPNPEPPATQYANSLWQPGARAFFRDQRASKVGDILRVMIEINDKAEVDNETLRERTSAEDVEVPSLFGSLRGKIIPGNRDEDLFGLATTSTSEGTGEIEREEKITTQVAAAIVQVLPNGNFVIDGTQEIRVNFELREITVSGVIRPEDIDADNTIDSSKIAMARINYGGRGQLTDVQQPRWGQQVIEAVSPF